MEPASTLDLVLAPNPDVEHSYEFVQVEVPFEGGTQLATYSPSYGGYVVRTADTHVLARKIHVYNSREQRAEYTWTYTPLDVLEEVKAAEELLRCGVTESPVLGSEPLVRVPDDSDPYVWLSSNAQGTGPWVGGLREGEWVYTTRHSIEEGRALDSYVSSLWARKGETGHAVRLIVIQSFVRSH